MQEAATRLRRGEPDVERIATLTGVPAALVDLMRDGARADATGPRTHGEGRDRRGNPRLLAPRRTVLLMSALVLGAVAIAGGIVGVATERRWAGDAAVAAAVLALLGCRLAARAR